MSPRLAGLAAGCLLLAGCTNTAGTAASAPPSSSPSSPSSPSASSASPSATGDAIDEWCGAYAVITGVLANSGTTQAGAEKALQALSRFNELWAIAGKGELITPDEMQANNRAVVKYWDVITLISQGAPESSPEVKAAREILAATTERDHALLQSSAGKVVALCGKPTAVPSVPPTGTG